MAASLAHKLAIANAHITADVVEVSEFPELAQRYSIYGVPKTVINETVQFEGAVPEQVFVAQVLAAAGAELRQDGGSEVADA
jgi:predicted DsbA family dithiol-disulfide isomerase